MIDRHDPGRRVVHVELPADMLRFPMPVPILLAPAAIVIEAAAAAEEGGEPGGETDHEPLRQIEGLEENFLRQFKCLAEGSEDFDARFVRVHAAIPNSFLQSRQVSIRRGVGKGDVRTLSVPKSSSSSFSSLEKKRRIEDEDENENEQRMAN